MKNIFIAYSIYLLLSVVDYSFLYQNEYLWLWDWVEPVYIIQFIIVGIICCMGICKQSIKEFSDNILNSESIIILIIYVVFVFLILEISSFTGKYDINWIGVIYQIVDCLIFVGISEEWVFRGFIVTQLERVLQNKKMIVIVSSVLFAFMHLPVFFLYTNHFSLGRIAYRLLIPFLIGMVFSLIFYGKRICSL